MTRTERLLRLAKLRGDRAAELIVSCASCEHPHADHGRLGCRVRNGIHRCPCYATSDYLARWTEAELRAAWGDR